MGRNHARVLAGLEGVELVGVVDPMGDKNGWAQGAPVLSAVDELIALGIDYAVVACPTALHEEVGLQLADADVCALIEKPLADTVEGARRLVEAFESRGLVAGVGHIERCNPALRSLRSRLEAGELGDVFQVVTRRQGPFPHRIADVGVVKDLVSAVGKLSDGTMVNHLVNWLSPLKERFTSVTGERGCYIADTLTADLTFHSNAAVTTEWEALRAFRGVSEGDMIRYAIPKREPLLVEHELFRDAVRGEAADICTLRQGLRTVEVAASVLESASSGR